MTWRSDTKGYIIIWWRHKPIFRPKHGRRRVNSGNGYVSSRTRRRRRGRVQAANDPSVIITPYAYQSLAGDIDMLITALDSSITNPDKSALIERWPHLMDQVTATTASSDELQREDLSVTAAERAIADAVGPRMTLIGASVVAPGEAGPVVVQQPSAPPPSSPPSSYYPDNSDDLLARLGGLTLQDLSPTTTSDRRREKEATPHLRNSPHVVREKKRHRSREGMMRSCSTHHDVGGISTRHGKKCKRCTHRDNEKDELIRDLLKSYHELEEMYHLAVLEKKAALMGVWGGKRRQSPHADRVAKSIRRLCHSMPDTTRRPATSVLMDLEPPLCKSSTTPSVNSTPISRSPSLSSGSDGHNDDREDLYLSRLSPQPHSPERKHSTNSPQMPDSLHHLLSKLEHVERLLRDR